MKSGLWFTRKNKYNAKKTFVGDKSFPSRLEAAVYEMLLFREKSGEISEIKLQDTIRFDLLGISWKIDFSFFENGEKKRIEAKGLETGEYRLKKKIYSVFGDCPLEIWKMRGKKLYCDETIIPKNPIVP